MRFLFVLSTGRVGTQSLAQLLSLSPDIHAEHEPKPRLLWLSKQSYQAGIEDVDSTTSEYLSNREALVDRACSGGGWYAETSNRITYLAPALAACLPDARFIHLHRHPAEVVRSGMRRRWYNGHIEDVFRIEPRTDDPFHSTWPAFSAFERVCWYWQAVNRHSMDITRGLPTDRVFTVNSAELFENPIGVGRLFNWLNMPKPSDSAIQRVLELRCNAQRRGRFPEYTQWSAEQQQYLRVIASSTASELGYSLDPVLVSNRKRQTERIRK